MVRGAEVLDKSTEFVRKPQEVLDQSEGGGVEPVCSDSSWIHAQHPLEMMNPLKDSIKDRGSVY